MAQTLKQGFRLGICVFKDAEIVDFAAPYGVFSVARRYDPGLDVFLIADAARTMEYKAAYDLYRRDVEYAAPRARSLEAIR